MSKALFTLTDAAKDQVHSLLAKREKPSFGIRIGVKQRGCSGKSYTIEYADDRTEFDEILDLGDLKILIDPKAVLFIIGTEMDFVQTDLESGFVFRNPNEKGRCGCGESFHV